MNNTSDRPRLGITPVVLAAMGGVWLVAVTWASLSGLLIALNVVLLLAIALVLYFVFRPAPPDVTPGDPLPAVPNASAVPNAPKVTAPAAPSIPAVPAARR